MAVDLFAIFLVVTQSALAGSIAGRQGYDAAGVEVQISIDDTSGHNDTSPMAYGIMFEDINHSGDGGIYAEMVTNRAFQGSNWITGTVPGLDGALIVESENPSVPLGPVLTGWGPIGDVRMTLNTLHPLSDALPTVMQIDVPAYATGEVGFQNFGWWGMDVRPQTYTASFYALANEPRYMDNSTTFTVSLRSNLTGEVWASTTLDTLRLPTLDYVQLNATIENGVTAPNSNNTFAITMDASEVAGQTFYFDLMSLFPETFRDRKNGLRKDLAEAYVDMGVKFLRFPGGNNLEGVSVDARWKWWETIGPLKDRPGRLGDWGYFNTDGLGLLEYLEWCEDMSIEPVIGVYAGFSLDIYGQVGTDWPEDRMDEVLDEALGLLEYCMGDTSTKWGAMRAEHGHPEPFDVNFVEVGNEDWFSATYPYRWNAMYNGLKAAYPDITIISSAFDENDDYTISLPDGTIWDTHHYEEPQYFISRFDFYDNWQAETGNEGVGVFLGEFSVYQVDTPSGVVDYSNPPNLHIFHPRMISALAEAVYALGGERNPNTVRMSAYAPTLQNFNWYNWTPDMIGFTADVTETVLSTSYWWQWMFSRFTGSKSVPIVPTSGDFGPLYWSSQWHEAANKVYVKVCIKGIALQPNADCHSSSTSTIPRPFLSRSTSTCRTWPSMPRFSQPTIRMRQIPSSTPTW
ncbi:glycoside hydrolase superfamily [Lineolata rhizophorae]|uniref:non-reducing end alpha-L-arabinofuranosidase n=1 Tax=Lineolata rhizophorae TaxID=578093 RepID=A0A6A6P3Y0_9PEZI|nr:glycoside hydrolase superfamily [Lineolata rhizophorae]